MTTCKIRLIHSLSRAGTTIICRVIGCMDSVMLLSEIHPAGLYCPAKQALQYHNLLSVDEVNNLDGFESTIKLIQGRCEERDDILVIRGWEHLDFIGTPFREPQYKLTLGQLYPTALSVAIIRHPIDQFISIKSRQLMRGLTISTFLKGYSEFVKAIDGLQLVQYEKFCKDPGRWTEVICRALELEKDWTWPYKYFVYRNITGDTQSRGLGKPIQSLPRYKIDNDLREAFESNKYYDECLKLGGYE